MLWNAINLIFAMSSTAPPTEGEGSDGRGEPERSTIRRPSNSVHFPYQSWSFDVLSKSTEELLEIIPSIYICFNLFEEFHVAPETFAAFTRGISNGYLDQPYHNFRHGCDVLHAVYLVTVTTKFYEVYSKLEVRNLVYIFFVLLPEYNAV